MVVCLTQGLVTLPLLHSYSLLIIYCRSLINYYYIALMIGDHYHCGYYISQPGLRARCSSTAKKL